MRLQSRIADRTARVGVIGLGYVGLPFAVTAAKAGFPITGFDIDQTKMDRLDTGTSYIEAVSDEALAAVAERFDWTTDFSGLAECDIIICVPTPLMASRKPDFSFVEDTTRVIVEHITPDTVVALESTTWPGTTEEVPTPIFADSGLKPGTEIFVGYSPSARTPATRATTPKPSRRSWPTMARSRAI